MIIDFHTHIFPKEIAEKSIAVLAANSSLTPITDGTLEDLLRVSKNAGVDINVVQNIATNPKQNINVNNFAISLINVPGIIPFGSIHPEFKDYENELIRLKDNGVKGIKMHPDYQEFHVDEERVMPIYEKIEEFAGGTPLMRLRGFERLRGINAALLGKLEMFNPSGSIKDRAAIAMIDDAEKRGLLKPGGTIIEPTSGNTGIGLAMIAAARGYKIILTMPSNMSEERKILLKTYGAELILTEAPLGMGGAIEKAASFSREIKNSYMPMQFKNPANVEIHFNTTGPEIWNDAEGRLDYFVCGVGTGGTLSGAGAYLKKLNPSLRVVAVEPAGSPVLSGGDAGPHSIQGIGAGFVPEILNLEIIDEIAAVTEDEAMRAAKELFKSEGIFAGISSGAALHAAVEIAKRNENKIFAVVLPDSGNRYLSVFK